MRVVALALLLPTGALAGSGHRREAGLTSSPAAELAAVRQEDLAIYPGFEKHELPASVRATLRAAAVCSRQGTTNDPPRTEPALAPYVSAEVADGQPVAMLVREVDLSCHAAPVRRCSYTYAWAEGSDEVGYAAVQCVGSHDDAYTTYIVTAARDLRKAKKAGREGTRKDKAERLVSVSFQTTEFPGTHLSAFVGLRRRDGVESVAAAVTQFDDFAAQDDELGSPVDGPVLLELADATLAAACFGVGQCPADGPPTR
jgi:hypothetical protein